MESTTGVKAHLEGVMTSTFSKAEAKSKEAFSEVLGEFFDEDRLKHLSSISAVIALNAFTSGFEAAFDSYRSLGDIVSKEKSDGK